MNQERDKYLFFELGATWLLVELLLSLFWEALPGYNFIFAGGLCLGFAFSWLNRNRHMPKLTIFINLAVLADALWIIYALLNSYFSYREVVFIGLKAVIVLEIILSFNAACRQLLAYIQAAGVLLLMSYAPLHKTYDAASLALIFICVILWLLAGRLNLYSLFVPARSLVRNYQKNTWIPALALTLIPGLGLGWLYLGFFPLGDTTKAGLLQEERTMEEGLENLEKEYFRSQDKLQDELTRKIQEFPSAQGRQDVLFALSSLIKDSPQTMEVEEARQGLKTSLKITGPGDRPDSAKEITYTKEREIYNNVRSLINMKSALRIKRARENIADRLRKELRLLERIPLSLGVNKLANSQSLAQLRRQEKLLQDKLQEFRLGTAAEKSINTQARALGDWRILELYIRKARQAESRISSLKNSGFSEQAQDLLENIQALVKASEIASLQNGLNSLGQGTAGNGLEAAIAGELSEILDLKLEMLVSRANLELSRQLPANFNPDAFSREELEDQQRQIEASASGTQFSEVFILLEAKKELLVKEESQTRAAEAIRQEQELRQSEEAQELKELIWRYILLLLIILIILLIVVLLVSFIACYILREKRKKRLFFLYKQDIGRFIIELYENSLAILGVFNLRPRDVVPALTYARTVENYYSFKEKIFTLFTARFEEAKYSRHSLNTAVADTVLKSYNESLKIIFSRYGKAKMLLRYSWLFLFYRLPTFI